MFMPKQKLHTHEEVFKDHVSGQYDETIFRFRVPGGWIYTHTIIRFGSVDKNYVADTFVPDSTMDMDLPPIHPTDERCWCGVNLLGPAHMHASGLRLGPAFARARSDQFALKLGQAAHDRQHQSAMRRCGVSPGIGQRL